MQVWRFRLTDDPAWPWGLPYVGPAALLLVALLLVALTVWTYAGTRRPGAWRMIVVLIALRLFALFLAVLCLWRPSFGYTTGAPLPGTILIMSDGSRSMLIQDVDGN